MKKRMNFPYQERLLFCFIGGILGGTFIANLLSSELQSQIGYFDALFLSGGVLSVSEKHQLWIYVMRQRLLEAAGAWLVSLTVFSSLGFCFLMMLAGGSTAVMLSVITCQKGMLGLPCYLATILPQYLFYIPVWVILASWAGEHAHPIRVRAILILLVLIVVGAGTEVYINPYLAGIFQKI